MGDEPSKPPPTPLASRIAGIVGKAPEAKTEVASTAASERSGRSPTFKPASLQLITGERFDVVVKNISATGARVEFVRDVQLPDRVLLREPTLQLSTWAYVIWQEHGAAGLEFVHDPGTG